MYLRLYESECYTHKGMHVIFGKDFAEYTARYNRRALFCDIHSCDHRSAFSCATGCFAARLRLVAFTCLLHHKRPLPPMTGFVLASDHLDDKMKLLGYTLQSPKFYSNKV